MAPDGGTARLRQPCTTRGLGSIPPSHVVHRGCDIGARLLRLAGVSDSPRFFLSLSWSKEPEPLMELTSRSLKNVLSCGLKSF